MADVRDVNPKAFYVASRRSSGETAQTSTSAVSSSKPTTVRDNLFPAPGDASAGRGDEGLVAIDVHGPLDG